MRFTIIMVAHLLLVGGDFMHKSGLIILVSSVLFTFLGGVGGVQKKMMSLHKLTFLDFLLILFTRSRAFIA